MGLDHLTPTDVGNSFGIPTASGGMPFGNPGQNAAGNVPPELINYNKNFKKADSIMFRDQVISEIYAVLLANKKPNVLLVGPAGCGKTTIAEEIARQIANKNLQVPSALLPMTVYELPLVNLVSGSGVVGQLEEKTKNIIAFAEKNKVILFIDEIHLLLSENETYNKIAQILKPALAQGNIRVIGATTTQEARDLLSDPALSRRFSQITVNEISQEQELVLLQKMMPPLLKHYQNQIDFPTDLLANVVTISDDVLRPHTHRPDSGLTLLDRVMGEAIATKQALIATYTNKGQTAIADGLKNDPQAHINLRMIEKTATKIIAGIQVKPEVNQKDLVTALKPVMYQDQAKEQIVKLLLTHQLGIFNKDQPLSVMLVGSSGVGKTMLSKLVAKAITNTEPIILNMTEYNSNMTVTRILGSPAGYIGSNSHAELPFDILESNPYQVILLDEFEKACPAVQRLFMRVLDEGKLQLANNHVLDFSKAIIFITTNAANSNHSEHLVGFNNNNNDKVTDELKGSFDNEVLNRFSMIVKFNSLSSDDFKQIMQVKYQEIYPNLQYKLTKAPKTLDQSTLDKLTAKFYDRAFGARPATKALEYYIQTLI